MDLVTLGLGIALLGFGGYTFYARAKTPHKLGKLQAMKDKFGNGAGTLIHTVAYSLIPIVAGAVLVWSA